jgi:hypothetical protein
MLVEQEGILLVKITPNNNFLTNQPIFTSNIPIDSTRQAVTHRLSKFYKIRFREQSGNFREKNALE